MSIPYIEIIESVTPNPNLLMWKFSDAGAEIFNGARLTVRETQKVIFLSEGQVCDVFSSGLHTLTTKNIPLLSTLKGWKYGFESPFKADIYFFNTHQFIDNKWGTVAPIMLEDPKFGQVRIRAFGFYNFRIADVTTFFRQYAGTYQQLTLSELQSQLKDLVSPKLGEVLVKESIPVVELSGALTAISRKIEPLLKPYFSELGLELTHFSVASANLPDEVSAFYDKVTSMNMLDDMDKFTRFQTAEAIGNPTSSANDGVQSAMMMGVMMNQLQQMNMQEKQQFSSSVDELATKLQKLKLLFDGGLIDESEYRAKKASLLDEL